MADSIFDDKNAMPNDGMLAQALGETYKYWEDIKNHLAAEYGELIEDWKFYNQKSGWILKTLKKKRNLFFFIPVDGRFKMTFVFGDRAVDAVEQSNLPGDIKKTLRNARKYAEGRGLQIEVDASDKVEIVKKLVEIKVNH